MATISRGTKRKRFEFIQRYGQELGISYLCEWLKVSRGGFYAWRDRPLSQRALDDQRLVAQIAHIHRDSRGTYGSPRVHQALKRQDLFVGKKRVERLMREHGLVGKVMKVTHRGSGGKRMAASGDNLRLGQPAPKKIDEIWVSDLTYIKVKDTYKFLIVIMDLYSRRVLRWSLAENRTTQETTAALQAAIRKRQPADGLIFHTDRGIEYTGKAFRKMLAQHGMKVSVNRLGFCTDNGHMESFFHTLKTELIRGKHFKTMNELRSALNSYITHFYNKKRLHSGIGYCSPTEYEKLAA